MFKSSQCHFLRADIPHLHRSAREFNFQITIIQVQKDASQNLCFSRCSAAEMTRSPDMENRSPQNRMLFPCARRAGQNGRFLLRADGIYAQFTSRRRNYEKLTQILGPIYGGITHGPAQGRRHKRDLRANRRKGFEGEQGRRRGPSCLVL